VSPSPDDYRGALASIERIMDREADSDAIVRLTVEVLHDRLETYSWVGIYFVEEAELVLGPWKGPQATDHVRIPIGEGVCGAAASSGMTEIVADVAADPRYMACFPQTRSEIVVPVHYEGTVVAEIDVDSDTPAAFGAADREFLERVATVISPHCLVGWDTGGMDWDAPENWR
jgi:L-methionine (R)-S-oxide reductase